MEKRILIVGGANPLDALMSLLSQRPDMAPGLPLNAFSAAMEGPVPSDFMAAKDAFSAYSMNDVLLTKQLEEALPEDKPFNIQEELDTRNLRLVHINHTSCGKDCPFRSGTVVYHRKKGQTMIEVSVVWLNPKEAYSRQLGAEYAIGRFDAGETVELPVGKDIHPVDLIHHVFGQMPK